MLFQILVMMVAWDQLDTSNLASAELLARRILQIERAVRNNPAAPSFAGLERFTQHSLDQSGGLATTEFAQYTATQAQQDAQILKQQRLLREGALQQRLGHPHLVRCFAVSVTPRRAQCAAGGIVVSAPKTR